MGISRVASRHTLKTITAANAAGIKYVESGAPIQVFGFVINNESAATTWLVTDGSGTTLMPIQIVAAKSSQEFTIPWLADAGIGFRNDKGDGSVTVFHGNPGA